ARANLLKPSLRTSGQELRTEWYSGHRILPDLVCLGSHRKREPITYSTPPVHLRRSSTLWYSHSRRYSAAASERCAHRRRNKRRNWLGAVHPDHSKKTMEWLTPQVAC